MRRVFVALVSDSANNWVIWTIKSYMTVVETIVIRAEVPPTHKKVK